MNVPPFPIATAAAKLYQRACELGSREACEAL